MKIKFSGVYLKLRDLDYGDIFINALGSICMKLPVIMSDEELNVYNLTLNRFSFYSDDIEVLAVDAELKIK